MNLDELLETVRAFDGVLELAPAEGSEFPEIAWGDHFFYYAPDGQVPPNQPYATVVTKDYPGEPGSGLDPESRFRVNLHVGKARLLELLGEVHDAETDFTEADTILPHPVYAAVGWVSVVNPGRETTPVVQELLIAAHEDAKRRTGRRE